MPKFKESDLPEIGGIYDSRDGKILVCDYYEEHGLLNVHAVKLNTPNIPDLISLLNEITNEQAIALAMLYGATKIVCVANLNQLKKVYSPVRDRNLAVYLKSQQSDTE